MKQVQSCNSCNAGMADVPSAAFVFDEDLVCKLEIEDFLDTYGILLLWRMIGLA